MGSNQNNNPLVDALLQALSTPVKPNPTASVGDLRPIQMQANSQLTPQPAPIAPVESRPVKAAPQLDENGQTPFGRLLATLGIPLAATVAGVANPNFLPAAAGISKGYSEGRKDVMDRTEPIYSYDKASGKTQRVGNVRKDAKVIQTGDNSPTEFDIHKEARQSVNAMLQNNPTAQMDMMNDPQKYNTMVDDQVRIIKEKLGLTPVETKTPAKTTDTGFSSRDEAINFLKTHQKALTEENIKKVLGG